MIYQGKNHRAFVAIAIIIGLICIAIPSLYRHLTKPPKLNIDQTEIHYFSICDPHENSSIIFVAYLPLGTAERLMISDNEMQTLLRDMTSNALADIVSSVLLGIVYSEDSIEQFQIEEHNEWRNEEISIDDLARHNITSKEDFYDAFMTAPIKMDAIRVEDGFVAKREGCTFNFFPRHLRAMPLTERVK